MLSKNKNIQFGILRLKLLLKVWFSKFTYQRSQEKLKFSLSKWNNVNLIGNKKIILEIH